MEKQTIEVGNQFFEVPNYVEDNKLEEFKDYCQLQLEWEQANKKFELEEGVIVTFPRVLKRHKKILQTKPKEVQEEFEKQRQYVQGLLIKMMHSKGRIFKKSSKDVKAELEDHTTQILELLGQDYSVAEVHKIFKDKNVNIAYPVLLKFAKRNEEKVRELKNIWREGIDDVSISIKRSRLEKLNYLLNDLLQHYERATPLSKITYSKEIRGILDQARKEVEGEEVKLTINGRIDIEATISTYLNQHNILRDLTIHQIVISRVAARLGIPSGAIIDRLAFSFYSKFNGFNSNKDLSTKILYPSAVNYDILDLENKNKTLETKTFEPVEVKVDHYLSKTRVRDGRDKLNKKLEQLLDRNQEIKKKL